MIRLRSQSLRLAKSAIPIAHSRPASLIGNNFVYANQARGLASKSWAETFSWLAAPKGFERYEKGAKTRSADEKVSTEKGSNPTDKVENDPLKGNTSKAEDGKAKGEGEGRRKPRGDPNRPSQTEMMRMILLLGVMSFVAMFSGGTSNSKEIAWQDFQKQLLETGLVDRIIVSNKKVAKVVLRARAYEDPHSQTTDSADSKEGFGWNVDGSEDFHKDDAAVSVPQAPNFTRYPTVGNLSRPTSPYHFNIGTVESFERRLEDAQKQLGISPRDYIPVIYVDETDFMEEITRFLPTLILIAGMFFLAQRAMSGGSKDGPGGIFSFGKSKAKIVNKEKVTTNFSDVAGCDEAKREIMEFVQFLKDPKRFTDLGAKIPKGALLCGPPGTGKTLLARATAGEANVPFFAISGSDFVEMFVGVGPSRVRDLFEQARQNAPCIVFIDEIDAVGRQRGRGGMSGGNDERENTLNQLLVEMDGFDKSTNIVVLAGTNRVDILDAALTRPGRFDRQITVDRPDIKGRKAIFEIYLKNITLEGKIEDMSGRLAALTPGFVGADIANICNEAAIVAARRDKKAVQLEDFETATDRIIGGLESRKIMSPEEKKVVAYHEAGHAVAGWFLEYADPLLKVTIVPRGSGALGFAQYLPKELFLRTRSQILDMVCMALAGRAAEEITFGRVTTGAADDLRRVTQIVYQMVSVYGMNEKIGQVAFPKEEGSFPGDRLYSDATAEVIDQEVRSIVQEAYTRTLTLMREKESEVKMVAELLLSKETITNVDIASMIGRRPFAGNKEYDEYLEYGWKPPVEEVAQAVDAEKADDVDNTIAGSERLTPV